MIVRPIGKLLHTAIIVCLFNYFTTAQIPTSGLVAYWPLNGNFNDAGPNAINGTNFGATATANKFGAASNALDFNNPTGTVNQYGTHPVNSNVNFSGAQNFSISFLFYLKSPYVHTVGFYDNNLNYNGYGVWLWISGGAYRVQFNFRNSNVSSASIPLATWTHVVCVHESGTMRMYIDGNLQASTTAGTGTPVYTYPPRFGSMFFNGLTPPQYNGLHGAMDELRIYNRALSDVEIDNMSNATLPLQLKSFTAVAQPDGTSLNWETLSETNTSHFDIESSSNAQQFNKIGNVTAKGNSTDVNNYTFTDAVKNEVVFYRLKMVDKDGSFTYSRIVTVRSKKGVKWQLFPNPAADVLQLQIPSAQKTEATVTIHDMVGRVMYRNVLILQAGNNAVSLPVNHLPKGRYTLQLHTAEETSTQSFIKQ
jgi:hypothetical protein